MTNNTDSDNLRRQAESLSKRMPAISERGDDFKPLVVEFAGSPKAGKSTTIDTVAHFFKRTGFRVWSPTEGASKRTPSQLRSDWVAFNAWALNYAVSEILVACHSAEPCDLVILDRGPFDSLAWMRLLRDRKELSDDEYDRFDRFAQHPKWAGIVGRIYLFTCSPETSMRREHEHKLIKSEGTAMNPEMLGELLKQYESLKNEARISYFRTDNGDDPRKTAGEIVGDIMNLLEEKARDA